MEFYDAMSVPMAIALSGQLLLNQPIMVKPSEAEKNLVQCTTAVRGVAGEALVMLSCSPSCNVVLQFGIPIVHLSSHVDVYRRVYQRGGVHIDVLV